MYVVNSCACMLEQVQWFWWMCWTMRQATAMSWQCVPVMLWQGPSLTQWFTLLLRYSAHVTHPASNFEWQDWLWLIADVKIVNVILYLDISLLKFKSKWRNWDVSKEVSILLTADAPSPPVDIIWAMMIVWRITGKIVRTVSCCVVYNSFAQWYAHTSAVLKKECWLTCRFSCCALVYV